MTKAQLHAQVKDLESKLTLLSEQIATDQEELFNYRTMTLMDKVYHVFGIKPKSKIIDNSLEVFGGV